MTLAALSTAGAILAWIGLALGVVVLGVVVSLLNRVIGPAREIEAYAGDVLDAGLAIAGNLDDVGAIERTRELGGALPGLAVAYLDKLKGGGA